MSFIRTDKYNMYKSQFIPTLYNSCTSEQLNLNSKSNKNEQKIKTYSK